MDPIFTIGTIISALGLIYMVFYTRNVSSKIDDTVERIENVTIGIQDSIELFNDPEQRNALIQEFTSSLATVGYQTLKGSAMGRASGDVRKRQKITQMVQETVMHDVLPELVSSNPLIGRIMGKLIGDSPVGEYLDENPEDFPLVMEIAGSLASHFMKGTNSDVLNGLLGPSGDLSTPGQVDAWQ